MPQTGARGDPSKAAPVIRRAEGRYANYLFLVFLIGSPIVLAVDCEFCAWFLVVLIYDAAAAASIASMSNLQRAVAPRRGRDSFSRSTRKREQEKEKKEDG